MSENLKIGIVGAGIQGVCSALFLQKKGYDVTLFDRDEPGSPAASYGNAGHFSPYASIPLNRPDILLDVPAMLLSSTGPLALKWNYVPKMIPWFLKFILNCSKKKMMHTAKYTHQILNLALPAFDELFDEVDISGLVEKKVCHSSLADRKALLEEGSIFSLRQQCDLLGINRASLYYRSVGESEENLHLMRLLDEQYTRTPYYGVLRMTAWLRQQGHSVNPKRVRRLLRTMGLEALYQKPNTSSPDSEHQIFPYLLRGRVIDRCDQVWSTDITYSVPGVRGKHGCLNEPQVYLKFTGKLQELPCS